MKYQTTERYNEEELGFFALRLPWGQSCRCLSARNLVGVDLAPVGVVAGGGEVGVHGDVAGKARLTPRLGPAETTTETNTPHVSKPAAQKTCSCCKLPSLKYICKRARSYCNLLPWVHSCCAR